MRKLFIIIFALLTLPTMAQVKVHAVGNQQTASCSLSVRAVAGQSFWLFVDDVLQNENSVKSICIEDMVPRDYYIRVEMDNQEHNCVGQYVKLDGSKSFEFSQRNKFYGLVAIQGGFRPELTLQFSENHKNGNVPFMKHADFRQAKTQIENESFDNSRLNLAKQIVSGNKMSATQITEICKLFSFENNALDFAKFAYQFCTEPNKYYLVNEVFKFDSSKRELIDYINGK